MIMSKKLLIWLISIISVVALLAITIIILFCTLWEVKIKTTVTQIDDLQKISVNWDVSKSVKDVEVIISHDGNKIMSTKFYNQDEIKSGVKEFDAFYGKIDVTVKVNRGLRTTSKTTRVNVFANEYVIAPLTATLPVTLLSLNLKEITNDYQIPTFVWFKRSSVWNYNNMPTNIYTIPVATGKEIISNTNQETIYSRTSAWIKELHEINPDSKFNLYYNDYYAYGWLQATIANNIPASQYEVTMMSDGAASFTMFNELFTSDDDKYTETYNSMLEKYNKLKEQISTKKYYKENDKKFVIEAGELRKYAYIMAKEESNVRWWLTATRNAIYDINNVAEGETKKKTDVKALETSGKIVSKALNASFNGMTADEKEDLKALYSFGDDLFEEAQQQNKKAMIILGTWQTYEYDFDAYVAATIAYYGTEDYVYYYKGHPRNPTPTVSGKMEHLQSIGLIDVDSTIAAELLFFYYPDLLLCTGYDSSTYNSLTDEQSGSIWNFTESNFIASAKSYINNIDSCFTVADKTNSEYGSFITGDNKTILIEKLNSTDIYLYDTVTKNLKHLVLNTTSNQYEEA